MDQHSHLTPQDLHAFAGGALPRERALTVVAHLLQGCETCRAEAAPQWRPAAPVAQGSYDAVFDRLAATLQDGVPAAEAPVAQEGPERVDEILQQAWALRHDDPADMLRLTRLAVLTASGLTPETWGDRRVADVRCRAWAGFGNACRIQGDLEQAQGALEQAARFLGHGTGDPLTRAQLYDFQASLESAFGHHDLALAALDAVQAIHRERGDRHMEGRALISKGLQTGYAGRSREAYHLTQEGLALIDEERDPGLTASAIHNQLWFLVESGHAAEARGLLRTHRNRLAASQTQRLDLFWLAGRIDAGLCDDDGAQLNLEAAARAFTLAGRHSQAASVKLDLAAVQIRLGEPVRALALIRDAEEAFARLEAPRSTRTALAFLRRSLTEREVSPQLVLRLADLIRRHQRAVRG
jgi:tetratricopeptide (TPR) repeat protein